MTTNCPQCGYTIDHQFAPDDPMARPRHGDISVCLNCQHILVFGEDGHSLELPTEEQIQEFRADPELWNMIQKYRWAIKETDRPKKPE